MSMQVVSPEKNPAFPDAEKIISSSEIEQAVAKMAAQLQPSITPNSTQLPSSTIGCS